MPKAASSALQFWCDGARDRLAAEGVDYPDPRSQHLMKKHPQLVRELMDGRADTLARDVAASRAPTILVSNEGFSARYSSFPATSGPALRAAAAGRRISLFLIWREPESWMRSLWAQGIINPSVRGAAPLTCDFDSFAARSSVRRMLDIPARAAEMQALTGADEVVTARAEGDWFGALLDMLGVARRPDDAPARVHRAVPAHTIELVRRITEQSGEHRGLIRAALLAAIEAGGPTGNVTIANTARGYAGWPPARQARSARLLRKVLRGIETDTDEMSAQRRVILDWARQQQAAARAVNP